MISAVSKVILRYYSASSSSQPEHFIPRPICLLKKNVYICVMNKKYQTPDIEPLSAALRQLLCDSKEGSIEDFQDDGEFTW